MVPAMLVSMLQGGGPEFLPPRKLASHLVPFGRAARIQVTAPQAGSSVKHFLWPMRHGRETPLLAQTMTLLRKRLPFSCPHPLSVPRPPPAQTLRCLLLSPAPLSFFFSLHSLSVLFFISLLDTFGIWQSKPLSIFIRSGHITHITPGGISQASRQTLLCQDTRTSSATLYRRERQDTGRTGTTAPGADAVQCGFPSQVTLLQCLGLVYSLT